MQKIQLAQGFLANAKAALGPDKFAVFQQSLRKYKAKDITIQRVICDCLPVFLSVSDAALRADLLKVKQKNFANKKKKVPPLSLLFVCKGFETFIPAKYHAEFQQTVLDMQASEKKVVKRTTHVREESAAPSSVSKPALDRLVQERKREQQQALALASSKTPIVVGSSSPGDALANESRANDAKNASNAPPKSDPGTPSKPHCPICLDVFKSPFSAVCGHICCHACWQTWLQQKLECPVCKEKVRFKQLRKVKIFPCSSQTRNKPKRTNRFTGDKQTTKIKQRFFLNIDLVHFSSFLSFFFSCLLSIARISDSVGVNGKNGLSFRQIGRVVNLSKQIRQK